MGDGKAKELQTIFSIFHLFNIPNYWRHSQCKYDLYWSVDLIEPCITGVITWSPEGFLFLQLYKTVFILKVATQKNNMCFYKNIWWIAAILPSSANNYVFSGQ